MASLKSLICSFSGLLFFLGSFAQLSDHPVFPVRPIVNAFDSAYAANLPLLKMPERYRGRSIPSSIDNTKLPFWPGISDQRNYFTCQQYCGVLYVYGYEINRLRNQPGWYWENRFPPHYTWNLLNHGEQYAGVNFFQSFDFIRQQGHITQPDFGVDTAYGTLGWINGYEKYFRGMHNRLKKVSAIRVNSEEGILILKNYLYDHLDGSSAGGIACFTTSGQSLYSMGILPPGTPEEGKHVVFSWIADPTHGLTIVGYNDSIRYDRNQDGVFTNNLDINGDGVVNVHDWEIGAFKFANSYGGWWADEGVAYVLYSAMANEYGDGGVWNNSVFVLDADTACNPLLTVRVNLEFNQRDKIRMLAGISSDTNRTMPDYTLEFPLFNFQGGNHPLQGLDSIPGNDTLEFGLDITPLLSHADPGNPSRLFFMIEERDQDGSALGMIRRVAFNFYGENTTTFTSPSLNLPVQRNDVTVVSAIVDPVFPRVHITTPQLPPYVQGQLYAVELQAANGHEPYQWSLVETYEKSPVNASLPPVGGQQLFPQNYLEPFAVVSLPFSFPFYGNHYDSLYVNFNGFVSPDQPCLPLPYVTDEISMMKQSKLISPAFSQAYEYYDGKGDGLWFEGSSSEAVFRWKASLGGTLAPSVNFGLRLFPDGRFELLYGDIPNSGDKPFVYTGISQGNEQNYLITPVWNLTELSNKAFSFSPIPLPENISLNESGLLTIFHPDSTLISDIQVKVTDADHISGTRTFQFSDGLIIGSQLISGDDNLLIYGRDAKMNLTLTNQGANAIQSLEIKLNTDTDGLVITDSTEVLSQLNAGQTLTLENAFTFHLRDPLPDKSSVGLTYTARSSQLKRIKSEHHAVSAPEIFFSEPGISDGADHMLQPGEIADLVIPVLNMGSVAGENMEARLEFQDTSLLVISDTLLVIGQLSPTAEKILNFRLKASRYITSGDKIPFCLKLNNHAEINRELNFELNIGKIPLAIVKLSSATSSADSMKRILDSLRIPCQVFNSLPASLSDYSCLFVLLGASTQGSHIITADEGDALAEYLNGGGRLYLEGYTNWYFSSNASIQPMFRYSSARVPVYYYSPVMGVPQTLGDSLAFDYMNSIHYANFSFEPVDPGYATIIDTAGTPHAMEIVYDGEDYKTIGSMLEFGSLKDSLGFSTKAKLMQRYLDFFEFNTSGLFALFHADQTSICAQHPAVFVDDSYDDVESWQWEFPGGIPAVSAERNPVVTYNFPGSYDVRLSVSDGKHNQSLLKKGYVCVNQCQGIGDSGTVIRFLVYPNPAKDKIMIRTNRDLYKLNLEIFDISGRIVIKKSLSRSEFTDHFFLDISSLRQGLYIVHMQSEAGIGMAKLIVN